MKLFRNYRSETDDQEELIIARDSMNEMNIYRRYKEWPFLIFPKNLRFL